jgi:hypothetical protein
VSSKRRLFSVSRHRVRVARTLIGGPGDPATVRVAKMTAKEKDDMALPFDETQGARDPRALAILAKTIYRELRASGYAERDVMTLASELLGMVASEVKGRRDADS